MLDAGRIVEQGTHAELLALHGHYEKLWRHQSGGFLAEDISPAVDVADEEVPDASLTDKIDDVVPGESKNALLNG